MAQPTFWLKFWLVPPPDRTIKRISWFTECARSLEQHRKRCHIIWWYDKNYYSILLSDITHEPLLINQGVHSTCSSRRSLSLSMIRLTSSSGYSSGSSHQWSAVEEHRLSLGEISVFNLNISLNNINMYQIMQKHTHCVMSIICRSLSDIQYCSCSSSWCSLWSSRCSPSPRSCYWVKFRQ